MNRFILLVAVLSSVSVTIIFAEENRGPCTGCPAEHDASDPEILQKTTQILATMNSNHEVAKVLHVKKQVVAGLKYIVKFQTKENNVCELSWVEQAWISKEPQYVELKDCV